jgi:hypothetical protein
LAKVFKIILHAPVIIGSLRVPEAIDSGKINYGYFENIMPP